MAKSKSPFSQSLKEALLKVGLPGQQRDAVQWMLTRFIDEVCIVATLNQTTQKRQALLDQKQADLLCDLNDLGDTESPTPTPSTT